MQALNIFHVLIAIALIAFVLVQRGQGATAGAAFGSGASGTVFGSRGAGNFLSRTTWVLATLFCAISLTMAVVVSRMMEAPEENLGVIASSQQEAPASEGEAVQELSVAPDESAQPDLPAFEPTAEDIPAAGQQSVPDAAGEEVPLENSEEGVPGPATDNS